MMSAEGARLLLDLGTSVAFIMLLLQNNIVIGYIHLYLLRGKTLHQSCSELEILNHNFDQKLILIIIIEK